MPTGYQIYDQSQIYFLTLQVIDWVYVFTRKRYRDILIESLEYCQKKKTLEIFAFVIISNHLHLIVRSASDKLSATVRDFKSYTSKQILESIENESESRREWMLKLFVSAAYKHKRNSKYQFWTHENHAEEITTQFMLEQKLTYVHQNPVKEGWVAQAHEYKYSSATNYAGGKSFLEVEVIMTSW